ncbi:1-acyl-sn-glycerol-3-phosphate acyltransferase [Pseudoalteromonas carrageenovora]|uniref:lysophospholipid acyltransferase family protein n=1 Tax=Pseudoalteromonas carrageenovora TaxID=227 RepID=UPI002117CB77|nr:lysophospholipid acyltransferase family protein [Pseudoalteromonas carrageenovora]MCQ8889877.1 1-acyl-sn-glycerol-3-phosphate acyltransferase [Pseudoalteromonas carrageenovora]
MLNTIIRVLGLFWRIIATGLCFSIFGVGGLFLTLLVFPAQRLFQRCPIKQKENARAVVHYSFKFFVALMHYTGAIRFHIKDKVHLANLKGELVLANHPSLIDVVVLISVIKNVDCVVKAHLFKNPFMRGVIKSTGYISNEDSQELLRECEQTLKRGNNLIVFPEGTRTVPHNTLKFKRGAANIALRCHAPITTVLIKMKPNTLTKGTPWYKVAPYQAHFSMQLAPHSFKSTIAYVSDVPAIQSRQLTKGLQQYFTKELSYI